MQPALLYSNCPHYVTDGTIFGEKVIEYKMCALIFLQALSETFLILRRTKRHVKKNVY